MLLHSIKDFLNGVIAHALLWTLIHSLWQGILIALIAALLVNNTKKSVAFIRYKLLGCLLCGFALVSIITFFYELSKPVNNKASVQLTPDISNTYLVYAAAHTSLKQFITEAFLYIQRYENYIVLLWIIIVVFKCVNMLAALRHIYRLKHEQVFDAGTFWNNRLKELSAKLGITKQVILLKSSIAEIPMMASHFKPVILFPAAALTGLPVEDVEAILLHELAHIRRNDYLVNMLQSFVEIIFFFNPAVLWLSSLIKEERENCCDDIALHQTKNKKQFIHALVAFKEQAINMQQAVSFSGRRFHLLNRLKRIITNKNKTLNTMEKTFLAAGIIITVFAAVAFTKIRQPLFSNAGHKIDYVKSNFFANKNDTTEPTQVNDNESKTFISNSLNGKHFKLIETNGKTELYVDDVKVPDDKIADYIDVIKKLKQQATIDKKKQIEEMNAQAEAIKAQDEAMASQSEAMEESDSAIAMHDYSNADKLYKLNTVNEELNDLSAAIADSVQKALSSKEVIALKEQAKVLQAQAVKMRSKINSRQVEAIRKQAELLAKQSIDVNDAMNNEAKAKLDYSKAELDKQMDQLKVEQDELKEQSEILKQQQEQMKAEMDKQSEIMKQREMQMKDNYQKQYEQLRQQQTILIEQLNRERDSINTAKPVAPAKPHK